jgi:hypothetical protein
MFWIVAAVGVVVAWSMLRLFTGERARRVAWMEYEARVIAERAAAIEAARRAALNSKPAPPAAAAKPAAAPAPARKAA